MPGRERIDTELVVIGAGAAGLYSALTAASLGASVTVISATPLAQTASYWAQGGLAAALGDDDSPALVRLDDQVVHSRVMGQHQQRHNVTVRGQITAGVEAAGQVGDVSGVSLAEGAHIVVSAIHLVRQ